MCTYTFIDINECDIGSDDCGNNSICANTIGSFTCTCEIGYQGSSGRNCVGKTFVYDANACDMVKFCVPVVLQNICIILCLNDISKFLFTKAKVISSYYQTYLTKCPHSNMSYQ